MSILSKLNPFTINPFSDGGQSKRVDEIKSDRAGGFITQNQFDTLMETENAIRGYIRLKRFAMVILFTGIGWALFF